MGKQLSCDEMSIFFEKLTKIYDIYGPKILKNGGRFSDDAIVGYGQLQSLNELELTEKSYFSPKEVVFPVRQTLFYFNQGECVEPKGSDKPILLFLRSCDIEGIKRLDTMFLKNGNVEDPYYKQLRSRVTFAMIECTEGEDSCFCVTMRSHQSKDFGFALKKTNDSYLIHLKDSSFNDLINVGAEVPYEPTGVTQNKIKLTLPDLSEVGTAIFDHPLWTEYTRRCIACGRCNTSCITCSCFTMQDVLHGDGQSGERRRRWAGCHVDGFSDMAGGHSFRKKNGERMRFKTLHKISDFKKRFGVHMCVGCGRCTDVCPEHISFSTAIEKINSALKEVKNP